MKCWESINIPIDDVLIPPRLALAHSLIDEYYDSTEDYVLFPVTVTDVFSLKFIELLASVKLNLYPRNVGFLLKPNELGFPHCDYYPGDIGPLGEYHTPNPVDERSFYKTSLHIDLVGAGSLEWFEHKSPNGKTLEESANVKNNKRGVWYYEIDYLDINLNKIDSLSGIGVNVCRTDIPHRSVNLTGSPDLRKSKFRVVLTARFEGNPEFDEVVSKLQNIVF